MFSQKSKIISLGKLHVMLCVVGVLLCYPCATALKCRFGCFTDVLFSLLVIFSFKGSEKVVLLVHFCFAIFFGFVVRFVSWVL